MSGPQRRRDERARRRLRRRVRLASMALFGAAAVAAFAAGLIVPGLLLVAAGLAIVTAAALEARPANWPPADRGTDRS